MKKIAFLFLVIDNPNFPKIWNSYFRGHKDKYNIYIHPKFPDKLTWNKKCMINNLKETKKVINMLCGEGSVFKSAPKVPHAIIAITPAKCLSLITKPWDECTVPIIYENLATNL